MEPRDRDESRSEGLQAAFPSTCWSRILGSPEDSAADPDLELLARTYWRPVYGYIRKRWAKTEEDARDRTQDFFVWILDSGFLAKADRSRGRFRGFLKTSLRNFLTDAERKSRSQKRGGSRPHFSLDFRADDASIEIPDGGAASPEEVLDRMWRTELVEHATRTLERELRAQAKQVYYDVFRDYFLNPEPGIDYKLVAERYGITPVNVSNYLTYAKKRYRAHLEAAVRETVTSTEDFHRELAWLFGERER